MAKRFKSKKNKNKRLELYAICFLIILSFAFFLSYFSSFFSKESVLTFILNTNLFSSKHEQNEQKDILDFLLDYTIGRQELEEDEYDGSKSPQEYTPDPTPEENKENPLIFRWPLREPYFKNKYGVHFVLFLMGKRYPINILRSKSGNLAPTAQWVWLITKILFRF